MKEYIIAGVAILLVLAVGFVSIITFEVTSVLLYGIGGIVLIIIVALGLTYKKSKKTKPSGQGGTKTNKLHSIKEKYENTLRLIERAGSFADVDHAIHEIKLIHSDLSSLNCFTENLDIIEEKVDGYTFTAIEQKNKEVESKIKNAESVASENYSQELNKFIEHLTLKLNELTAAGFDVAQLKNDFLTATGKSADNLNAMMNKKDEIYAKFSEILNSCIESVANLSIDAKSHGDTTQIDQLITDARNNMGDFDNCSFLLVRVRNELTGVVGDVFSSQHQSLLSSIEKIVKLLGSEQISTENKRKIKELMNETYNLNDAGQIQELSKLENEFRNSVMDMVSTLNNKLADSESHLQELDLPEELWTPDDKSHSIVNSLDSSQELSLFTENVSNGIQNLISALDKNDDAQKIIENYPKIEPVITKKLETKGEVIGKDLGVFNPEKFLLLYALKHPNTQISGSPPTLRRSGDAGVGEDLAVSAGPLAEIEEKCKDKKNYIIKEVLNNKFLKKLIDEALEKGYAVPQDIAKIGKEEYLPCILIYYANQNGYEIAAESKDKDILLYSLATVGGKIEDIINNLLEPKFNKEYKYPVIKEPLKIPLPDSEIKLLIEKLESEGKLKHDVEIKDDSITFKEEN